MPEVQLTELGVTLTELGQIATVFGDDEAPAAATPNVYGTQVKIMGYHIPSTGRYANTLALTLATGTIATTTTGPAVELGDRSAIRLDLTITGTPAGTSPTLDVAVQTSGDGTTWAAVAAFAQQNAAGTTRKVFGPLDRFVRIVETIGGTGGPSFVRTVSGEAV